MFFGAQQGGPGDPIAGADLIRQYERNEMTGWGYIFAGQVLIENGVGGKYITKLRKELIEAPMFHPDRNIRMVNNILNVTVQAVRATKGFMPGSKTSDIFFSAAGAYLGIQGEMLLYENSSSLAPKILEVNPQWYNDNISPIFSPQKFGGGGASGDW